MPLNINRIDNKIIELNEYIQLKGPDIICVQETHKNRELKDCYLWIRSDRDV
jgi:exonuclease III